MEEVQNIVNQNMAMNPVLLTGLIIVFGLMPFFAMMASTFVKISVVILLVRNALGVQQIPPSMAINGLSIILTVYIMAPIGVEAYNIFQTFDVDFNNLRDPNLYRAITESAEPLREFLLKFSNDAERDFFVRTTQRLWPEEMAQGVTDRNILILLPAFVTSQLSSAFQVGFLIYLPFIVIDLVISSILLAMGMMMVSPMTISLPFKLMLFVMVDGWTRLLHGIVLSYQ